MQTVGASSAQCRTCRIFLYNKNGHRIASFLSQHDGHSMRINIQLFFYLISSLRQSTNIFIVTVKIIYIESFIFIPYSSLDLEIFYHLPISPSVTVRPVSPTFELVRTSGCITKSLFLSRFILSGIDTGTLHPNMNRNLTSHPHPDLLFIIVEVSHDKIFPFNLTHLL